MIKKRWFWLVAIATGVILLLTLLFAPAGGKLYSGSTYSRAPDGYGAWYAFMETRGTPVRRWQKPFDELPTSQNPMTFLRVNSQISPEWLNFQEQKWVEQGNTLVVLGVRSPITPAEFSSIQKSPVGGVKIETGRRQKELSQEEKRELGDRFGSIVWQKPLGKGQVIFATTPHLAANAYQDEPGNFTFLAQLVTPKGKTVGDNLTQPNLFPESKIQNPKSKIQKPLWVDEYIHGYKDKDVLAKEDNKNWLSYLAKTPLFPTLLQAGVILVVLILAKNRRLGPPISLTAPTVDNSEAYIQALAGVLQKAETRQFVVEMVGKEEQLQLQKTLGLGSILLDPQTLVAAWVQQTGRPAAELEQVLQLQSKKQRISKQDLLTWLEKWQKIQANR